MIGNIVLPVFFLYVVLVSGYCSSLLNCGLQRFMRDSVYFKHFLIFLSIYIFTFILNWYTFDSLAISQQEDFMSEEEQIENNFDLYQKEFTIFQKDGISFETKKLILFLKELFSSKKTILINILKEKIQENNLILQI